jgi:hypothetical protein
MGTLFSSASRRFGNATKYGPVLVVRHKPSNSNSNSNKRSKRLDSRMYHARFIWARNAPFHAERPDNRARVGIMLDEESEEEGVKTCGARAFGDVSYLGPAITPSLNPSQSLATLW